MRKVLLLLAVVAAVATAGCSTTNMEFATKDEVLALRGDVNRLAAGSQKVLQGSELLRQDVAEHQKVLTNHAQVINGHEGRWKTVESAISSQDRAITVQSQRIARAELEIRSVTNYVSRINRSVEETNARLVVLEKGVVGVRQMAEGRLGALEDTGGIDHKTRLLRLSGFATKSFDLTVTMKRRLDEMIALVKKGEWSISSVVGFADTVPYLDKDKKDLNPELARNRAKSVAQYLADALSKTVPFEGHGATTKFGDQDMNRSVLVHLERVSSVAPAPAAPVTPPATTKKP